MTGMLRLYVAGPMTGRPHFNFDVFDAMSEALRSVGYDVVSPAELDDPEDRARAMASEDGAPIHYTYGKTHADFLARDLKIIADQIDGIVVLPEWETSTGARIETFIGASYGKPIWQFDGRYLTRVPALTLFRAWTQEPGLSIYHGWHR
jgi:hypothetical protein